MTSVAFAFRMTAIALAAAATGCASTPTTQRSASAPITTTQSPPSQPATQPAVARAEQQLPSGAEVPLLGPPDAKPGECYARVFNPARYETRPEQVVKTPATDRVEIIPAQTEEVEEQVMVKPPTSRIEVVPPVYETVEEQVLVEPERKVLEQVPAQYETVTDRVMVKPAIQAWKKASEGASGSITKVDAATGEVLCLVEIPPEYETVTKQVVKTPATTRERTIPPVYKTVQRQVLKTPATTREVQVPAEYATVKVTKVVAPAREQRVPVPAVYETVQRTVLVAPAKEEWRQVLCEANTRTDEVRQLQDALRSAGYDPGPSDGRLNDRTLQALRDYQAAHNLPVDRGEYVNLQTAQALQAQTPTTAGGAPAAASTNTAPDDSTPTAGATDQSGSMVPGEGSAEDDSGSPASSTATQQ